MADEQVILALAEQAYMFNLLVKTLRKNGTLEQGQPEAGWKTPEFAQFLGDYRKRYFSEP